MANETCGECKGSGDYMGFIEVSPCRACDGTGIWDATPSKTNACEACKGRGSFVDYNGTRSCRACNGTGKKDYCFTVKDGKLEESPAERWRVKEAYTTTSVAKSPISEKVSEVMSATMKGAGKAYAELLFGGSSISPQMKLTGLAEDPDFAVPESVAPVGVCTEVDKATGKITIEMQEPVKQNDKRFGPKKEKDSCGIKIDGDCCSTLTLKEMKEAGEIYLKEEAEQTLKDPLWARIEETPGKGSGHS